jgi:predicted Zn-dependent protease with MMP-like domain
MIEITDNEFSNLIADCLDELPEQYVKGLKNVLITYEDEPTHEQLTKQNLSHGQTLYGLYEGIPLTNRGAGYQLVVPDRITLFKLPLVRSSGDLKSLKSQVKHTLWHEVAHFYGLDHDRIQAIETNWK